MSIDKDFDDRAAAALVVEEGIDWETARRYASTLRQAGALKSGTDVQRMKIGVAMDAPTSVDIRLENGFRVGIPCRPHVRRSPSTGSHLTA